MPENMGVRMHSVLFPAEIDPFDFESAPAERLVKSIT